MMTYDIFLLYVALLFFHLHFHLDVVLKKVLLSYKVGFRHKNRLLFLICQRREYIGAARLLLFVVAIACQWEKHLTLVMLHVVAKRGAIDAFQPLRQKRILTQ